MKDTFLIARIDKLLQNAFELSKRMKKSSEPSFLSSSEAVVERVDEIGMKNFRLLSLSYIEKLYTKENLYYQTFFEASKNSYKFNLEQCIGVLESIKNEIESGWLNELKDLVSVDIFSDFLEMGKYFLDEKYKDAAAVIIGSVLEKHLKNVAERNEIECYKEKDGKLIPLKISVINDELYKKNIYNKIVHMSIIHIFSIRNEAAHGNYDEYELKEVENMYATVNHLLIQIS